MGEPPRNWPAPLPEDWLRAASRQARHARVDPSVPNVARVWDSMTGGHDNFEADRSAARQLLAASPLMSQVGPASRAFLRRAVTYLAAEAGITQFLDIGTGMPAQGSVHSVAQAVDPSCRVVYVDNDPVVLVARARLAPLAGRRRDQLPRGGRQGHAGAPRRGAPDPRPGQAGRPAHDP